MLRNRNGVDARAYGKELRARDLHTPTMEVLGRPTTTLPIGKAEECGLSITTGTPTPTT